MNTRSVKWVILGLSSILVASCFSTHAIAEDAFPSKPIKIIVPVIGGTNDLIARLVAPKLSEAFGQPVIVENKPGASGNIATGFVVNAAPDGYTILVGFTGPIAVSQSLYKDLPYNPATDLAPITLAVSSPQFLVVNPAVPAKNLKEFITLAKSRPGKLNYASISPGSASHLTMELLKHEAGIDLVHVPYKGAAPAMTDLVGGTVQAAFFVVANALPFVKSGQLRILAVTGNKRVAAAPDVPTMIESGFPGFDATAWIGFFAPAKTPPAIIDRYNREIIRILNEPAIRSRIEALAFNVIGSTPDEFARFIQTEIATWAKVIKEANVHIN